MRLDCFFLYWKCNFNSRVVDANRLLCVVFRESPESFRIDLFNFARQNRAHKFGGNTAVARPVPIPNTAVKRCMADGSGCIASARVGSRQSFKIPGAVSGDFSFSRPAPAVCCAWVQFDTVLQFWRLDSLRGTSARRQTAARSADCPNPQRVEPETC